ncbi:MAG: glycosyltransferase family 1 protein [Sulfuricurvum sp.]|nr:glycosyltransferase family 1 protein [Sulfuricurvum sp.]
MNTETPISLIVNLSPLRPPLTGIGHYTREMLIRLLQNPQIKDVQGFYYHRWLQKEEIVKLLHPDSVSASTSSWLTKLIQFPGVRAAYRKSLHWIHRRKMAALEGYVYWETNYLPLHFEGATMVTVYDLSYVRYPQFHPVDRVNAFKGGLEKALKNSASVLTISTFSQDEIQNVFGIPKEKIAIIPPGTSADFHPRSHDEVEPVRQKYLLPSTYFLSVATIEPRKNLKNIVLAYGELEREVREKFPLVLVGASGWLSDDLEPLIAPLEKQRMILRLGYVSQDDLPSLYNGASALFYLSLYEGYGMPVAEAIRSGIPVITSSLSSMPEVGGDCAWYADPSSVDSIVSAIRRMMASDSRLNPPESESLPPPFIQTWDDSQRQLQELLVSISNAKRSQ